MSDTFDDWGFDEDDYINGYARQASHEKDIWYYHQWCELLSFHQDFEKAVLVTLRTDSDTTRTLRVPKSIIGKMETTITFKTKETQTRYLIHTKTLAKLLDVDVIYKKDNKEYTFMSAAGHDRYFMDSSNDYGVSIPIKELTYLRYKNHDIV